MGTHESLQLLTATDLKLIQSGSIPKWLIPHVRYGVPGDQTLLEQAAETTPAGMANVRRVGVRPYSQRYGVTTLEIFGVIMESKAFQELLSNRAMIWGRVEALMISGSVIRGDVGPGVSLLGDGIGGALILTETRFSGNAYFHGADFLANRTRISKEIRFQCVRADDIEFIGVDARAPIGIENLEAAQIILDGDFYDEVALRAVTTEAISISGRVGNFDAHQLTVTEKFEARGVQFRGDTVISGSFGRPTASAAATVHSSNDSAVTSSDSLAIDLQGATFFGPAILQGLSVYGGIDATGAIFRQHSQLTGINFGGYRPSFGCNDRWSLDLTGGQAFQTLQIDTNMVAPIILRNANLQALRFRVHPNNESPTHAGDIGSCTLNLSGLLAATQDLGWQGNCDGLMSCGRGVESLHRKQLIWLREKDDLRKFRRELVRTVGDDLANDWYRRMRWEESSCVERVVLGHGLMYGVGGFPRLLGFIAFIVWMVLAVILYESKALIARDLAEPSRRSQALLSGLISLNVLLPIELLVATPEIRKDVHFLSIPIWVFTSGAKVAGLLLIGGVVLSWLGPL